MDVYLLPGLDGTGVLFSPFLRVAPAWATPIVIGYDHTRERDFDELALEVSKQINYDKKYILLGESFSGPVAILAAVKKPPNLVGVVLCASFISNPKPLMSLVTPPFLLAKAVKILSGRFFIRHFLASRNSPVELLNAAKSTIGSVPIEILVSRLLLSQKIDLSLQLVRLECPLL